MAQRSPLRDRAQRSPLMDRAPLFAKLPADLERRELFTRPDPAQRDRQRPYDPSASKESHASGILPSWISADTLGGVFIMLLVIGAALQLILFLRARDTLPAIEAIPREAHFRGLDHDFLSDLPEEWEEGDAMPSPPPPQALEDVHVELAAQIAQQLLTRSSIRTDSSGIISIAPVQVKSREADAIGGGMEASGEASTEASQDASRVADVTEPQRQNLKIDERRAETLPAKMDVEAAVLRFMADAQEVSAAEDAAMKDKMTAISNTYMASRGNNVVQNDPTFDAARKEFFTQFLASEKLTGALLWMVAHWDLHDVRQDWTDWTELNLARHATLSTIVETYRDSMIDPEPVDSLVELIKKFKEKRWRLAVGTRIPEIEEEL